MDTFKTANISHHQRSGDLYCYCEVLCVFPAYRVPERLRDILHPIRIHAISANVAAIVFQQEQSAQNYRCSLFVTVSDSIPVTTTDPIDLLFSRIARGDP